MVVTLCCPPVWWATPPYWELWLPWCTTATASSIALETTGKRNVHVLRNSLGLYNFRFSLFSFCFLAVMTLLNWICQNVKFYFNPSLPVFPGGSWCLSQPGSPVLTQTPARCTTASPAPCTRCCFWPQRLNFEKNKKTQELQEQLPFFFFKLICLLALCFSR